MLMKRFFAKAMPIDSINETKTLCTYVIKKHVPTALETDKTIIKCAYNIPLLFGDIVPTLL